MNTRFEDIDNKDGFYLTWLVASKDGTPDAAIFGEFFTAHFPMQILSVSAVWRQKSTGGAASILLMKDTGTQDKTSGTSVCGFDPSGTDETPVFKSGTDLNQAGKVLVKGDRLALWNNSGAITFLKDFQITLYCKRLDKGDYR